MGKLGVLLRLAKSPHKLMYVVLTKMQLKRLPDEYYLKLLYGLRFRKRINLDMPITYNEKLQWLKLHDRNPEYVVDVDKYAVRSKIGRIISSDLLIPILGVYDSTEQIQTETLPSKFVLKCTHGTHCSIVCKNKDHFDFEKAKKQLSVWLKHNYYYDSREWPYKKVVPRILVEEYIADKNDELIDYKFMCFNGKVKLILVHQDINNEKGRHTLDVYTPDWSLTEIEWGGPRSGKVLPRPNKLEECILISEKLAEGRIHVRVDLYIVIDRIYFGELTYYTAGGFKPFKRWDDDVLLGSWISLGRGTRKNEGN